VSSSSDSAGQPGDEVVITYRDRSIRFEPIGGRIEERLRIGRFYEEQLLQYIESLGLGGTYVDVGAFVGTHTLFFAAYCPARRIHAFEPRTRFFETLRRHLALNQLEERVTVHPLGLSDREESVPVVLDGRKETIVCRPLDDLIDEPVSVMKIDVEGMEAKVLAGASRILRESRPILFLESHTHEELDQQAALLAPYGYRVTGRVFNSTPTYEFAAPGSPTVPPRRLPQVHSLVDPRLWLPLDDGLEAIGTPGGGLRLSSRLAPDQRGHMSQKPLRLKRAPRPPLIPIERDSVLFLQVTGERTEGARVGFRLVEYDKRERTEIHVIHFHSRQFQRVDLRPDTRQIRIVIRMIGPGEVKLERFALHAVRR